MKPISKKATQAKDNHKVVLTSIDAAIVFFPLLFKPISENTWHFA
jgi:hypothetical protein